MSAALLDPSTPVLLESLAHRALPDGSALARPGETEAAMEATVWRALALRLGGAANAASSRNASAAVARQQAADGRVSVSDLHPGAYSPTSIAILAWHGSPEFEDARRRAVAFLLAQRGDHFPRSAASPVTVDTELAGWPWIERTFSWAEPTAMALLALDSADEGDHPRAREGRAVLLDRQIATGGWNYGNSRVFGSDLRPAPESTGLVLAALAGHTPATKVGASLQYLEAFAPAMRTPLALGWALLAWSAWRGAAAPFAATAIHETLARESRYGSYESADLALLAVAAAAPRGLLAALRESA
ncbi:MAG: hypothetical protein ABIV06_01900 [Thermoanaerobaculia bacterium]